MGKEHDRSYSCLVLMVFVRNIDKDECSSIKQLIEISDKLGEKINYKVDISYDTKISVINNMIKKGILVKGERGLTQPISIRPDIRKYLLEALAKCTFIVDSDKDGNK